MLILDYSNQFKKDFKKLLKASPQDIVDFGYVVGLLQRMQFLDGKYCDHDLIGNWKGYRECHIKPDLLLIYKQEQGLSKSSNNTPLSKILNYHFTSIKTKCFRQANSLTTSRLENFCDFHIILSRYIALVSIIVQDLY
ncbi:MAG: type II toxin-antitoxin system YafQ family toxin [Acinetobacter sp.]|nr:MAG: type II toxin-antitoxin system YafQ family toxin [Acinetobacter sp.]